MDRSRRRMLIKTACGALGAGMLGHESWPQSGSLAKEDYPAPRSVLDIPASPALRGFEWTGPTVPYSEMEKRGDTFPVTWAKDDRLYTSAGDPVWPDKGSGLDFECIDGPARDFRISRPNRMDDFRGAGGSGPKPTGLISVDGVLYLAFQNSTGRGEIHDVSDAIMNYGHGYDAQIIASSDFGRTWTPSLKDIEKPMFPGRLFGAPAFINFGKDNEGARDSFVYAISGEGWDNGVHCRLGRVPHDKILQKEAWEWISSIEKSGPVWTSNMSNATPILTHPGYLGTVDMVYLRSIKRYLLLAWRNKVKADPDCGSELLIYDAPEPWGPFTFVYHEDPWESIIMNPYNPRLPLKWFDHTKLEGWLLFSGSWRSGGKSPTYRAHVRPFRLHTT
jgi:Domain of unknown function (DUF4185)